MTYTRLTVIGSSRRADLVVPDDEPFALLLPDVLDLLGESAEYEGASVRLIRRTGEQIELAATPAETRLPNGEVLRVVRAEDAPPPPEVADVTDVVAESLQRRDDRWGETARRWTAAAAIAIVTGVLGLALGRALDDAASLVLAGGWLLALAAAVVLGLLRHSWARMWTTAVAVGLSMPLAELVQRATGGAVPVLLAAAVFVWIALAVGLGLAARSAPPAWGGLIGAGAATVWIALLLTPLPAASVPALIGLAAIVGIGLLPTFALGASGLSALDDAAIGGSLPSRRAVAASLEDAYAALAWAGGALAVTAGAAGAASAASGDLYGLLLAVAIGLVLALRTRQFPLIVHIVPLWAAALAVLLAVAASPLVPPLAGAVLLAAIVVGAVLLAGIRPPAHVRVRLRRWGNALELLAVVATVPLLLGTLHVYPDLLRVFS
ncbi:EsaB/YukD family protein [Microbacterium arborescens]|uniref:EsaB/YukD family protein n=1 Tax=Microbacterium arborescens TaxID=33883 RepID=UPI003C721BBB